MTDPGPTAACLKRTRSSVLNVLVAVGAGIALSGLILGRRERAGGLDVRQEMIVGRVALALLFVLIVASVAARRTIASRSALRDPARRAARFYRAHLAGAILGALAIPLGFAYGWAVGPKLNAVAPFWVAALALGSLALPRAHELDDFDEAMPGPNEPDS